MGCGCGGISGISARLREKDGSGTKRNGGNEAADGFRKVAPLKEGIAGTAGEEPAKEIPSRPAGFGQEPRLPRIGKPAGWGHG